MTEIREIAAKTLLARAKSPEAWFGVDYTFNVYRGCEHRCIYCDSRSECYGIDDFDSALQVKVNAPTVLERETARKAAPVTIGTGAMSDPYTPAELRYELTRAALLIALRRGLGFHLQTKSDLVLRDLDLLRELTGVRASVVFTLTTTDDGLAAKVEPGAPPPSRRLAAMAELAAVGIRTGTAMMPVLPFIEDTEANLRTVVRATAAAKGQFVLPWLGITLRDRQREYFLREVEASFPGLAARYRLVFGNRYECDAPDSSALYSVVAAECEAHGLLCRMEDVVAALRARGPRQTRFLG